MADGTVVSSLDGLPDQIPGRLPATSSITLETVDGNHAVQEIGGGLYAFYAHMIPGSLSVKVGDRVRAGDVLGSDGVPYVHRAFTLTGGIDPVRWESTDSLEGTWSTDGQSVRTGEYRAALPQNLHMVSWPES